MDSNDPRAPKPVVIHRARPADALPEEPRRCDCGTIISHDNKAGTCRDCSDAIYLPTQEEIAEACRKIQAGWSREEEIRRRAIGPSNEIELSPVHTPRRNQ